MTTANFTVRLHDMKAFAIAVHFQLKMRYTLGSPRHQVSASVVKTLKAMRDP